MTKIAINGFGRIGKCAARIILDEYKDIDIVAINSSAGAEKVAYMIKYDSTYGVLHDWDVSSSDDIVTLKKGSEARKIKVVASRDPENLPWGELGVDVVLECTGAFCQSSGGKGADQHISAGSKQVIISAPAKSEDIATVVLGVNQAEGLESMKGNDNNLISNASCTTNCIAPAAKVIADNFDIKTMSGITIHAYTASQELLDGYSKKNMRAGRAAPTNIIPTSTGAAKALELVVPSLKGKISLSAARIPVPSGSMVYITFELAKAVTIEEANNALKQAAETDLKGILEYCEDEIVSSDVVGNSHSCILDSKLTKVNGNTLELVLWYDNEWGYANRLVELINKIV